MVYNDTQKMNVFGEIIVYLLSIVVPIGVILITKATGNTHKEVAEYGDTIKYVIIKETIIRVHRGRNFDLSFREAQKGE